jgi:hypothetical protein
MDARGRLLQRGTGGRPVGASAEASKLLQEGVDGGSKRTGGETAFVARVERGGGRGGIDGEQPFDC